MPRVAGFVIVLVVGCRGGAPREQAAVPPAADAAIAVVVDAVAVDAAAEVDAGLDDAAVAAIDRSPLAVRLERIRGKQASSAALIDPTAGVVVRDHQGAHRVCGAALPLFFEAIDGALASATAPTCDGTTCVVQVPAPIADDEPNLALGFVGSPPRLEAVVWQEPGPRGAVSRRDVARAIRAAGPACPPDATAAAAIAAAPPATDGPMATKAWMRELADGRIAATTLVDPSVGIVVVAYHSGSDRMTPTTRTSQRRCGDAAIRELERRRPNLKSIVAYEDDIFHCANRPVPTCVVGSVGEGMLATRFRFRASGGALVVDTVIDVDSSYAAFDQPAVLARLRAQQLGGTCAP